MRSIMSIPSAIDVLSPRARELRPSAIPAASLPAGQLIGATGYPRLARSTFRNGMNRDNHHLWHSNGTWFLSYTVYPTQFTKQRFRHSLGTKDVRVARQRRDAVFARLSDSASAHLIPRA